MCKPKNRPLLLGSFLIAIAILFILCAVGLIPTVLAEIFISWQALIILVGITMLFIRCYINSLFILIVGAYFLIPHIFLVSGYEMPISKTDLTNIFIASLLIAIGVTIILVSKRWSGFKNKMVETLEDKYGVTQISSMFSETDHVVIEKPFKGLTTSTAFGEIIINMSKTTLPVGDSYLNTNVLFGTTTILVPESWNVQTLTNSMFSEIINDHENITAETTQTNSRLVIKGSVLFGQLKVRSIYQNKTEISDTQETIENISVKHNNSVHIITLDELQYIQADGDYVTLYSTQGKFLKEQTMKYFQNCLPSDRFIRIHRSYIVSISEISSVDNKGKEVYYVTLKDGTSLRASSAGYQILREKLGI